MLVNAVPMDGYTKGDKSSLIFAGGFDLQMLARHAKRPSTFLALSYPASNFEELKKTIGCIDFRRDDQEP